MADSQSFLQIFSNSRRCLSISLFTNTEKSLKVQRGPSICSHPVMLRTELGSLKECNKFIFLCKFDVTFLPKISVALFPNRTTFPLEMGFSVKMWKLNRLIVVLSAEIGNKLKMGNSTKKGKFEKKIFASHQKWPILLNTDF